MDAIKAARALKVTWQEPPTLPGNADLSVRCAPRRRRHGDRGLGRCREGLRSGRACALVGLSLSLSGPSAVRAELRTRRRDSRSPLIQSSTQMYTPRANMLSTVLGMPAEKIRVQYYEGSGTFGRSCYEDAAQAAAIMSQAVGRPVRVQYMRWDEHGWTIMARHILPKCAPASTQRQARGLRYQRLAARLDRDLFGA